MKYKLIYYAGGAEGDRIETDDFVTAARAYRAAYSNGSGRTPRAYMEGVGKLTIREADMLFGAEQWKNGYLSAVPGFHERMRWIRKAAHS